MYCLADDHMVEAAPNMDLATPSGRAGRLCEKRVRVEVLLAGATEPESLPIHNLVDADLWDQLPADLDDLLPLLMKIFLPSKVSWL